MLNNVLSLIDIIDILSFLIGLENLEMNITQNDLQEETAKLDKKVDEKVHKALHEIHLHLEVQDDKLDKVLKRLNYENNRNIKRND